MKVVEVPYYVRSPQKQAEMDMIVAELRRINPPKPRPVKPEGMSQEDFVLSLQTQAFQASMKRTDEEQAKWVARLTGPMPDGWQADKEAWDEYQKNPTDKNRDKLTGKRNINPDEYAAYKSMQRGPKNQLGESTDSATTNESRERAISAIIYTPPANVTKSEVETRGVNLVEYKTKPMTEVWVEMPWYKALFHRLKGNKIRQEIKRK